MNPLVAGSDPRPEGSGWKFVAYSYDPKSEVAKLRYERSDGAVEHRVEVRQPLTKHYETMRNEYFRRLRRRLKRQLREAQAAATERPVLGDLGDRVRIR